MVIVGGGTTMKSALLVTVPPMVVTAILPLLTPLGAVARMVVAFFPFTAVAANPLKVTAVT